MKKRVVKKPAKSKAHAKRSSVKKHKTKKRTTTRKAPRRKNKSKTITNKRRPIKKKSHAQTKSSVKERVVTNIPNLDKLIEGGFDKNSINLVVGDAGSGKSIFAMQFLMEGIKKGEKCLYVTFEEKKDQFYKHMKNLGWDLAKYEKKGLFTFLEYSPIKVKTMLEEGGGAIESSILRNKVTRLAIDSITSFALVFEDELEKREAALSLFNMIRHWNCTSILTFEGGPLEEEKTTSKTLEFESDSIIILYYPRERNQRNRYLEILKMRGTEHSKKVYKFLIEKNGIKISSKPSSGVKLRQL